jgi:hypothetical protein
MKARVIVLKCRGIIHNFPVLSALLFLAVFCYFSTASSINVLAGEKTAVRGKIKEVNPELKMVVMGLGSEHGLKENSVVYIYRDGVKIGAVKVLNVLSKHDVSGRIIEGEGFKVGDVVKELRVTSSGLRVIRKPATRNPQPATSDPQPATSNPQPATSNQRPATISDLAERVADLEKRVQALEKLLEATPPLSNEPVTDNEEMRNEELGMRNEGKSGIRTIPHSSFHIPHSPKPQATSPKSGEFDKTVDDMLNKQASDKVPGYHPQLPGKTGSEEKTSPMGSPRKFIVTDNGLEAENPEGTPLITGKVLGPYNKNKEIGIFLGKGHKAKRGYIFFIYRGSGEELKLVAKIKVEDVLADTVGGPILIQYDVVRETDRASTRMPEQE